MSSSRSVSVTAQHVDALSHRHLFPSGVAPLELHHLAEPEDRHRELAAGRHAVEYVPDSPVVGGLAHGNALDLQDDVTADDELLAHDRGEHGAAAQAHGIPGRAFRHALHEIARWLRKIEDLGDGARDEAAIEAAPEPWALAEHPLGRVDGHAETPP